MVIDRSMPIGLSSQSVAFLREEMVRNEYFAFADRRPLDWL